METVPGDSKTYSFKGSTLYSRGHSLLFCRVWGSEVLVYRGFEGFGLPPNPEPLTLNCGVPINPEP